jgi:hypothetical protein
MAKIFSATAGDEMDVYIYSRKEHPPAHCHVFYEGEEAIMFLDPVEIRAVSPYLNDWEIQKILDFIKQHQAHLISEWGRVTGLPLE